MSKFTLVNFSHWEELRSTLRMQCCGNLKKTLGFDSPKKFPCLLIWHGYIADGAHKYCIEYDFIYPGEI